VNCKLTEVDGTGSESCPVTGRVVLAVMKLFCYYATCNKPAGNSRYFDTILFCFSLYRSWGSTL